MYVPGPPHQPLACCTRTRGAGLLAATAACREAPAPYVRGTRSSLGRAVRTTYRGAAGEDLPETRAELWRRRRLIFCTPHILRNDLCNGLVDGKRIAPQQGQSAPLAGPQLGSGASSRCPWWI